MTVSRGADAALLAVRGSRELAAQEAEAAAGGGVRAAVGARGAGRLGAEPRRAGLVTPRHWADAAIGGNIGAGPPAAVPWQWRLLIAKWRCVP